jgi:sugar phosphate isomerase/epimerase
MRFGVATVCLPDLDVAACIESVAAAGLAGIEWRVAPRPDPLDAVPAHPYLAAGHRATIPLETEAAAAAGQATRAAGLEVIGLSPYVETGDSAMLRLSCEMAVAAGTKQIRLQAPRTARTGKPYHVLFDETVAFFVEVERAARAAGIRALLEIHHNTICPSASLAHRVVSRFDPVHIGVIYDLGNFVFEGYEAHEIALDLLDGYLGHVHLKNAAHFRAPGGGWKPGWTPLEDGEVNIPQVLALLAARGYDGWVSLEDMSLDRTPAQTLRHNAAQLHAWGLLG